MKARRRIGITRKTLNGFWYSHGVEAGERFKVSGALFVDTSAENDVSTLSIMAAQDLAERCHDVELEFPMLFFLFESESSSHFAKCLVDEELVPMYITDSIEIYA